MTPVLLLFGGHEIALDPVTISSNAVVSVDVNDALSARASRHSISSALYGSVVFRYTSNHAKNLTAEVMIHMHGQPIGYHVDAFPVFSEPRPGSREGIWWQPREGVKDFLVLSNSLDKAITGTLVLFDAAGKRWNERVALSGHQTLRTSVSDLIRRAGLAGDYGGIKFDVADNSGAVDSVHLLYDETVGFSAMMKMFDRNPEAKLEDRTRDGSNLWTMWAPMLALQSPDPALRFPQGTILNPTIFLYNPTPKNVSANVVLSWRGDSGTGKVLYPLCI